MHTVSTQFTFEVTIMHETDTFRCTVVVLSSNHVGIYTKNSEGHGIHIIAFFMHTGVNETQTLVFVIYRMYMSYVCVFGLNETLKLI
jgi:hypothetical protein